MTERIKMIYKDVTELNEYVERNKRNIAKLKEQYEKAVKFNERFTDRMRKEVFDLEGGMCGIHQVEDIISSWFDDEE